MMLELTRRGYADLAYSLVNRTTMPSWGYMVEHGATTIWERWDGWEEQRGFQNPGMNSFNHYAIGAVGEWMWRVIGGINPDESAPGCRRVVIQPMPGGGLTWAKASYDSIRGRIATDWSIDGEGVFTLNLSLPPGVAGLIRFPAGRTATASESGTPLDQVQGVRVIERSVRSLVLEVEPGNYRFRSK
jgi:alpha-L-rhamnosidase